MERELKSNSYYIKAICLFFSFAFLAAAPLGAAYINCWDDFFRGLFDILTLPAPLVTDYYQLGNLSAAFFNAALCGLSCSLLMILLNCDCQPSFLAGYFLVVAHCFYGLNFLNMWAPMLGILFFCHIMHLSFRDNLDMAMFSTAFGPFITEFLFRYNVSDHFIVQEPQFSWIGFLYVIIFSIFLGFAIPAMLPGALRLHKGYNLFNGGLAFGLLGLFLYAYMYKTFSISPPEPFEQPNAIYEAHGNSYQFFVVSFFLIVFLTLLFIGWYLNGKSFKGYGKLMKSSGHRANFFEEYGSPMVFINLGVYGIMMLSYFFIVINLFDGAGFTGPTTGVILASITFVSQGQHPRNVWPVLSGFVVLSLFVSTCEMLFGFNVEWTLSTQAYMNGAAFATGLCPITGHYGKRFGMIAGFMCAVMCTSTSAIHGGFVLYNGGLTSGITALILVPLLEYYWSGRKKA